jgi:hypothetical protein
MADAGLQSARRTFVWSIAFGAFGLLSIVPAVLGIFSPWGCERFTDAYPIGMQALRACPLAVQALGDNPDKAWGLSNFEIESGGEIGNAHFATKVTGGQQRGEYQVFATRTFSKWTLRSAMLLLPEQERIINVLACAEMSPPR